MAVSWAQLRLQPACLIAPSYAPIWTSRLQGSASSRKAVRCHGLGASAVALTVGRRVRRVSCPARPVILLFRWRRLAELRSLYGTWACIASCAEACASNAGRCVAALPSASRENECYTRPHCATAHPCGNQLATFTCFTGAHELERAQPQLAGFTCADANMSQAAQGSSISASADLKLDGVRTGQVTAHRTRAAASWRAIATVKGMHRCS